MNGTGKGEGWKGLSQKNGERKGEGKMDRRRPGRGGGEGLRREKEREKVYAERAGGKLYII